MRKLIAVFLFLIIATFCSAQTPQGAQPEKKPVHMGIGRTLTFPLRHPIKSQKAVAKAAKKTAQTIW